MREQSASLPVPHGSSRRELIRSCAAATAALTLVPILRSDGSKDASVAEKSGPGRRVLSLDQNWLFGGTLDTAALQPEFDDKAFSRVTLPHCVTPLSWQNWDPASWEHIWIYRRRFVLPRGFGGHRIFLEFDNVMAAATPVVNSRALPQHLGGFLPFQYEITGLVNEKENVVAVAVNSRWINVPPEGSPTCPSSIDCMLPGGVTGSVHLRAVPQVFISDVFAKPVSVLDSDRRLDVTCSVDYWLHSIGIRSPGGKPKGWFARYCRRLEKFWR